MVNGGDLTSTIAQKLHWPIDKTSIGEEKLEGLVGCQIYGAIDTRVHNMTGESVARLKDGSLIFSSEPHALDEVFARCTSAATPPGTLAKLMVNFSRYAGLRVLEDDSLIVAQDLLKKAGREFTAPGIVAGQGERVVRFMALSPDGSTLLELKGRIGKQVSVEAQRVANTY